jgi:hypothetical protein
MAFLLRPSLPWVPGYWNIGLDQDQLSSIIFSGQHRARAFESVEANVVQTALKRLGSAGLALAAGLSLP